MQRVPKTISFTLSTTRIHNKVHYFFCLFLNLGKNNGKRQTELECGKTVFLSFFSLDSEIKPMHRSLKDYRTSFCFQKGAEMNGNEIRTAEHPKLGFCGMQKKNQKRRAVAKKENDCGSCGRLWELWKGCKDRSLGSERIANNQDAVNKA